MTGPSVTRIEIVVNGAGYAVHAVCSGGERLPLASLVTRFAARDVGMGHAETFGVQLVDRTAPDTSDAEMRTFRWGTP